MNFNIFLFAIVTFASVLLYYPISNDAKWIARTPMSFETVYWNAAQTVVWGLGLIMMRGFPLPNIWAILPILPTTILYGLVSEQKGMDFDLTGDTPLTPLQIGLLSFIGVIVAIYIGIIFYTQDKSTLIWRLIPLLIFIIWTLTWLGINKSSATTNSKTMTNPAHENPWGQNIPGQMVTTTTTISYNLHFHHWMIGAIGFLVSISPDIYSQIASGIFWGIFCQESAAYGISMPSDSRINTSITSTNIPNNLGPGGTHSMLGPGGMSRY